MLKIRFLLKKVVIIGPAYPYKGGLAAFNQRLAEELEWKGIHTIIFTFSLQYPGVFYPGKTQFSPDVSSNSSLDIRPRINSINPFNWIKVAREIAELEPDVVICRYWMPYFALSLGSMLRIIKRNCSTQIVGLVDNLIPHERRLGDSLLTTYFMEAVDTFIVLSTKVHKDIESLKLNKPILKLHHPIYDQYGSQVSRKKALDYLQLQNGVTYLLFFGFVRKYKGLDMLLKALADPILRKANVKLIIAGEFYERKKKYLNLIRRLDIEDLVIIYPYYIPDRKVRYFFSASDLVVLPYRSATQSGIAQIALNFVRPVLISDVGGLTETVEDGCNGFISTPNSKGLARGISRFLNFKDKSHIQECIFDNQEQFSWNIFTRNLSEAIGINDLDLVLTL